MGNISSAEIHQDEWTKIAYRRYTLPTHCGMFRLNGILSGSPWPFREAQQSHLSVSFGENRPLNSTNQRGSATHWRHSARWNL